MVIYFGLVFLLVLVVVIMVSLSPKKKNKLLHKDIDKYAFDIRQHECESDCSFGGRGIKKTEYICRQHSDHGINKCHFDGKNYFPGESFFYKEFCTDKRCLTKN